MNRVIVLFMVVMLAMMLVSPALADTDGPPVSVTPAFDYGADMAVLSATDNQVVPENYTVHYLLTALAAFCVLVVGDIARGKIQSDKDKTIYAVLVDRMTSDMMLTDAAEAAYLAMPEGLSKDAVDLLADVAKRLTDLTPTDADDKLKTWLDQLRDGKPNAARASPVDIDPGIMK